MRRTIVALLVLFFLVPLQVSGAQRGEIVIQSDFDGQTLQRKFSEGVNRGLIIGIDEYENHPNLQTAVNDAVAVAAVLKDKYFFDPENIVLLKNGQATKDRIMRALRDLVVEKVKKGDNVFIYYAGHGWFDEAFEIGYWVTAEAGKSPATFLENSIVYKSVAALDRAGARHVYLVSDSCFSGSFLQEHRAVETDIDDRYFREKYAKPSRNILTSGGNEPVADGGKDGHSIFAYYFLRFLEQNRYPFVSAKQVGVYVEQMVARNSNQTPISRYIHGVGDEKGQFFFINKASRRGGGEPLPALPPVESPPSAGASFDDVKKRLQERQRIRSEWDEWLRQCESRFAEAREIDESDLATPEEKALVWSRVCDDLQSNHPYSQEDESMRDFAESRRKHWESQKAAGQKKKYGLQHVASVDPKIEEPKIEKTDRHFVKYKNGVVKDTRTGIEWYAGPDKDTDWNEAKRWVASLYFNGGGWRMPTRSELKGLYEEGRGSRNMTPLLETTGWRVWSGKKEGSSEAWFFSLAGGEALGSCYNPNTGRAFAVRSR